MLEDEPGAKGEHSAGSSDLLVQGTTARHQSGIALVGTAVSLDVQWLSEEVW